MKKIISFSLVLILSMAMRQARAEFAFSEPTKVPNVNSSSAEAGSYISANGLELYFRSDRPPHTSNVHDDIWVSKRLTINETWSIPIKLDPPVNSSKWPESAPCISADGLELYFTDGWSGISGYPPNSDGYGGGDIWVSTRKTEQDPWGDVTNLGSVVNTISRQDHPSISADGLSLYYSSRPGGSGQTNIYMTTRETKNDPWDPAEILNSNINSSTYESTPFISPDGLSLFFARGTSTTNIWVSRRKTTSDPWDSARRFEPVNSGKSERSLSFSTEDSTLYFCRGDEARAPSTFDIWQVEFTPVTDLNSDGFVDAADMCILVDNWHTENTLCDIAPPPLGDGFVDVKDLIVLAEHLFDNCRALAQWKLDEKAGDVAHDRVGGHDGILNGDPLWLPTGGQVAGALEFDGIDDYVSTPFVLNLGNGSSSFFAWIKSTTPGKAIISQTGDFGGTLIGTDPTDGKLMTGFSDMFFGALVSETVVTDDQWHHVGFVYDSDSLHRLLYVDGILVAEDTTVVSGMPSDGGLYIGVDKTISAGTFWTGLIDDVRIYNMSLSEEEIAALVQ